MGLADGIAWEREFGENAGVAQSAERAPRKGEAGGANPSTGTNKALRNALSVLSVEDIEGRVADPLRYREYVLGLLDTLELALTEVDRLQSERDKAYGNWREVLSEDIRAAYEVVVAARCVLDWVLVPEHRVLLEGGNRC